MIKKLSDYEAYLKSLLEVGRPLSAEQLLSVRTRIEFFQHERLAHEIVLVLFALLTVGSFLFFVACPEIMVLVLAALFLVLLVPYIKHYFGLENGVQRLYDLYAELEKL
ncbi:hypothetical protein [Fibrobacter sp. UWR2]|uniref:hypothetical protein n=1 Tax=Fibrobacter sp. UWR2 TaxID=1964352 RepID=UPI000B5247AD|nr:hypothetical protein [Fibrobacter sp. UWR2]OWU99191.1 hypothetical protein B7994_12235 [Fibrobacter sp. UWR2]